MPFPQTYIRINFLAILAYIRTDIYNTYSQTFSNRYEVEDGEKIQEITIGYFRIFRIQCFLDQIFKDSSEDKRYEIQSRWNLYICTYTHAQKYTLTYLDTYNHSNISFLSDDFKLQTLIFVFLILCFHLDLYLKKVLRVCCLSSH